MLDLEQLALGDRAAHHAGDLGVVALGGGDLEAVDGRVAAQRVHDLVARGGERALGQVLADEVDRRHQRLRLERQQPRGAGEVVAVGLGVDLDRVALHLGVEHVAAAAEVHDVQHVDVLAQLGLGDLQALAQLHEVELAAAARGLDQDAGERDQPGEALGADRALALAVVGRLLARRGASPAWPARSARSGAPPPCARARSASSTSSGGSRIRARSPRPSTQEISWRESP